MTWLESWKGLLKREENNSHQTKETVNYSLEILSHHAPVTAHFPSVAAGLRCKNRSNRLMERLVTRLHGELSQRSERARLRRPKPNNKAWGTSESAALDPISVVKMIHYDVFLAAAQNSCVATIHLIRLWRSCASQRLIYVKTLCPSASDKWWAREWDEQTSSWAHNSEKPENN